MRCVGRLIKQFTFRKDEVQILKDQYDYYALKELEGLAKKQLQEMAPRRIT